MNWYLFIEHCWSEVFLSSFSISIIPDSRHRIPCFWVSLFAFVYRVSRSAPQIRLLCKLILPLHTVHIIRSWMTWTEHVFSVLLTPYLTCTSLREVQNLFLLSQSQILLATSSFLLLVWWHVRAKNKIHFQFLTKLSLWIIEYKSWLKDLRSRFL